MYLQVLIFMLLFGALQGFLLLLILFRRKHIKPFHFFLCADITVLIFQAVLKSVSKLWVIELWGAGYSISYYLPLLYGPLAYLIACASMRDYTFKRKHLVHFFPFFLILLLFSLENISNKLPVPLLYLFSPWVRLVLQITSLFVYHLWAIKLLQKVREPSSNTYIPAHLNFTIKFIRLSLITSLLISWAMSFMYINFPDYQYVKWSFVLLSIFIYWISVQLFQMPASFEVVFGNPAAKENEGASKSKLTVLHAGPKYANSGLKDEQANDILDSLHGVMSSRKLFLDPALTADKLARVLGCHKHHLSRVLNEKAGMSLTSI